MASSAERHLRRINGQSNGSQIRLRLALDPGHRDPGSFMTTA